MTDAVATVTALLDALAADDTEAALDLLDVDVEWRNTGLPTLRGPKVAGALRQMSERGVGFRYEMRHAAADGDVVLTDRTDWLTLRRWEAGFWVRGTFRVRAGKVVLWDDAFSWGDMGLASALGLVRALRPR